MPAELVERRTQHGRFRARHDDGRNDDNCCDCPPYEFRLAINLGDEGAAAEASRLIWDTYGAVGSNKNRSFTPQFRPCEERSNTPAFPHDFQTIKPAKRGDMHDVWVPDKM
jgi:hypothetical protein